MTSTSRKEREQQTIPRGMKKKESSSKSPNDIKKTKKKERKKLSPEERTKRESSSKLLNDVQKSIRCFPDDGGGKCALIYNPWLITTLVGRLFLGTQGIVLNGAAIDFDLRFNLQPYINQHQRLVRVSLWTRHSLFGSNLGGGRLPNCVRFARPAEAKPEPMFRN